MGANQLAEYLSKLDAALPLPRRQRARILAEVADGLQCTVEAKLAAGLTVSAAQRVAIEEFGDATSLAREFAQALASGMARRVGLALVLSGPAVGLAWVAATGRGADLASRIASVLTGMSYLPLVLAITVPAAVIAVLAGSVSLRRNTSSRVATSAARVAASGCVFADLTLVVFAGAGLHTGHFGLSGWIAVAVTLSALRFAAASSATWRISRLRAAGY